MSRDTQTKPFNPHTKPLSPYSRKSAPASRPQSPRSHSQTYSRWNLGLLSGFGALPGFRICALSLLRVRGTQKTDRETERQRDRETRERERGERKKRERERREKREREREKKKKEREKREGRERETQSASVFGVSGVHIVGLRLRGGCSKVPNFCHPESTQSHLKRFGFSPKPCRFKIGVRSNTAHSDLPCL